MFNRLRKGFRHCLDAKPLIYKLHKKELPQQLIHMIFNMISDRKFRVIEQGKISTKTFSVKNGLQQGAINSAILFNLFFSDILTLFKINENQSCKAMAYVDDLIIYDGYRKVLVIRDKLQDFLQDIDRYCKNWRIKINFNKCEVILFKSKVSRLSRDAKREWKNFKLINLTNNAWNT